MVYNLGIQSLENIIINSKIKGDKPLKRFDQTNHNWNPEIVVCLKLEEIVIYYLVKSAETLQNNR